MKAMSLLIAALGASLFFGASDSWVYVHSGVSITNGSPVNVKALKQTLDGDFFWFTRGGKTYVVRDAASLQKVRDVYTPLLAQGAEQASLGAKQMNLTMAQASIEEQNAAAARQNELASRVDALNASTEKKLAVLAEELVRTGKARPAP